jgi:protocatechuate 3,4-dioxygenase beta subunit
LHSSREREEFATRTDAEGRYRLTGLPLGDENRLVAFTTGDVPYTAAGARINSSAAGVSHDFKLKRGLWAEGRVFDAETKKPFTGEISYFQFIDAELEKKLPGLRDVFLDGVYWTNKNGEFRVPVPVAHGMLAYRYQGSGMDHDNIDAYARGQGAEEITTGREPIGDTVHYRCRPHYVFPENYHRLVEVKPTDDQAVVRADMPLMQGTSLAVRVIDPEGRPVSNYVAYGVSNMWGWQHQQTGEFPVKAIKPGERRRVSAYHRERNLAAAAIIEEKTAGPFELKLQPAGSLTGRVLDEDGQPVTDATVYSVLGDNPGDDAAFWPPHPDLRSSAANIPLDKQGRFRLDGLIPGKRYTAHAQAPRKRDGEIQNADLGVVFQDVTVEPSQTKDLGDLVVGDKNDEQAQAEPPKDKPAEKTPMEKTSAEQATAPGVVIAGRITLPDGKPAVGANVAITALSTRPRRGGDLSSNGSVLAHGASDKDGQFRLAFAANAQTHQYASLIVRIDGRGLAWKQLDLGTPQAEVNLVLPDEEPIRGKLVDIEGMPAGGVHLTVTGLMKTTTDGNYSREGVGYRGEADAASAAWLPAVTSDAEGRFTIHGVPAGFGAYVDAKGDDRFAPQSILLNSGMPEQRGERDATYRSLIKNVAQGEEAVLALAPAQVFEGNITYADTGKPAANARLTIWASQQEQYGSMSSVEGKADATGHYRVSPHPGVRFGLIVYPPDGAAYLARKTPLDESIRWQAGDRVRQADMQLPRGVLVRGTILEEGTDKPVAGASIQYEPEGANNLFGKDDILTGWQGIQLSDDQGHFEIAVLPGPGRLLVHDADGKHILRETSEREVYRGTPGGRRYYAHAIERIEPAAGAEPIDLTLKLHPGATLAGKIVDETGAPVDEALVISRLHIEAHSLYWRGHLTPSLGGKFELNGLDPSVEYPVYFLDAKRKLGATHVLKADARDVSVVLRPCGQATARFVDSQGEPLDKFNANLYMIVTPGVPEFSNESEQGKLAADSDFAANVDRMNHDKVGRDEKGRSIYPALIPGATYRLSTYKDGEPVVFKEFSVEPGQQLDLGEFTFEPDSR